MARITRWLVVVMTVVSRVAGAQVSVQVQPDNGTHLDPKIRMANSTADSVVFTIVNNGTFDTRYTPTCSGTGVVTITTCPLIGLIAFGDSKPVTVVFSVGAAGTGSLQISVISTNPTGASGAGKWDETVVNPAATAVPTGGISILAKPSQTGLTYAFTVTNQARAKAAYTLTTPACPGPGATGCAVPTPIILDSAGAAGASATATVTYNTGSLGQSGTITLTPSYGATNLNPGTTTVYIPSATVTPHAGAVTVAPNLANLATTFTVTNTQVVASPAAPDTITMGCSPTGIFPCQLNRAKLTLAGQAHDTTVVSYSSLGAGSQGTVVVRALYNGALLDSGWVTVSVAADSVWPKGPTIVVPANTVSQHAFKIKNKGLVSTTFAVTAVCAPAGGIGTGCTANKTSVTIAPGVIDSSVVITDTTKALGSSPTVTLKTSFAGTTMDSGWVNLTVGTISAQVTPDSIIPFVRATGQTGLTQTFKIKNSGTLQTVDSLIASCTGAAPSGCAVNRVTVSPVAGVTDTAVVTYNTSTTAGFTGQVVLKARQAGSLLDSGFVTLSTAIPLGLDVAGVNPGATLARDACLTIAISAAAASECGDLRIVHPLPTVRVMSKARTPTLIYNSAHATPWVNVAANVTLPAADAIPAAISATLTINSVVVASGSWTGSQWTAGSARRIVLGFNPKAAGLASGVYAYTFTATLGATGAGLATTATGQLVVVDRSTSPFGAGWWLAGLEKIDINVGTNTLTWYGGDGSVHQFLPAVAGIWRAPNIAFPDSIQLVATQYIRRLPGGVQVVFDANGRHIQTINRLGHLTQFGYDGQGKLLTITLPANGGTALQYVFAYDANGRVKTVTAPGDPAARVDSLALDAATGRVLSIKGPDAYAVQFGYAASNQITTRTDRRNVVTSFTFDAGSMVVRDSITMAGPPQVVRSLRPAQTQGLAGTPAVDPSLVFTQLTGPRSVNITKWTLNRLGAPLVITQADNNQATLTRADPNFPNTLVTRLVTVTGQKLGAVYDVSGRVLSVTDSSWQNGKTSYTYGPFDQIATVTGPSGELTTYAGFDPVGNPSSVTTQLASTTLGYDAATHLQNSVSGPGALAASYLFDAQGNLRQITSGLGFVTTITNDGAGRLKTATTPIDAGQTKSQTVTYGYDLDNRVTLTTTTNTQDANSTSMTTLYDPEGNLFTATGASAPQSWTYDNAGHQVSETIAGTTESRVPDEAGDFTQVTTRRGDVITMGYNVMNRLATRSWLAFAYSARNDGILAHETIPAYTAPAGSESFTYTADGQVLTANNGDAQIARAINASGLLTSETSSIRTLAGALGSHIFVSNYDYDASKRRITLTVPSQLIPGTPRTSVGYAYYSWGGLQTVTDVFNNAFTYGYTTWGAPTSVTRPGTPTTIVESWLFDADGRVTSDGITAPSGTFPHFPTPTIRALTFDQYDARGKLLHAADASSFQDALTVTYSGLGYGLSTTLTDQGSNSLNQAVVGITNETYTYNALGDPLTGSSVISLQINGQPAGGSNAQTDKHYNSNGRLLTDVVNGGTRNFEYDAAGNNTWQKILGTLTTPSEHKALYYDAAGRLRHAVHAWDQVTAIPPRENEAAATNFYYDAFGRRIIAAGAFGNCTTTDPAKVAYCANNYVRRTIWDGTAELVEIQMPQGYPQYVEADTGGTNIDTGFGAGDINPFYGHVVMANGLATDQPLSIARFGYADLDSAATTSTAWTPFVLQPLWNYRGQGLQIAFTTGNPELPLTAGDTTCRVYGSHRCVRVDEPAAWSLYDQARDQYPFVWHGTALQDKKDREVAVTYRRNRYYDQQTQRFTQEDPIGLAGGLNLYGFANGDPVNFSDPFGLCPPADENYSDCAAGTSGWYAYRLATGKGNAVLNNVGGVLATCGESTACWATLGAGGLASLGVRALASRGAAVAAEGLGAEASSGALQAMEGQLATAGRSSVEKTIRSLTSRIAEHEAKIAEARAAGGNVASMEREIRAWRGTIDAARKVLGIP